MAEETFDPQKLLSMPMSAIKAPVRLPVGSYLGQATKFEFDKAKNEKQTPIVRYTIAPTEALPDVPQEDLALSLVDGEGKAQPLTSKEQRLEFWLTPDAVHRLKTFVEEHCKVPDAEGMQLGEAIQSVIGVPFMFTLIQTANKKNPAEPYINIGTTGPVPE